MVKSDFNWGLRDKGIEWEEGIMEVVKKLSLEIELFL